VEGYSLIIFAETQIYQGLQLIRKTFTHWILSPSRLPIPSHRQNRTLKIIHENGKKVNSLLPAAAALTPLKRSAGKQPQPGICPRFSPFPFSFFEMERQEGFRIPAGTADNHAPLTRRGVYSCKRLLRRLKNPAETE